MSVRGSGRDARRIGHSGRIAIIWLLALAMETTTYLVVGSRI
jgi:hypothetical protein